MPTESVVVAINALSKGKTVLLLDDVGTTPAGHLVHAGDQITADAVNFMAAAGRSVICVAMTAERADALGLRPMPGPANNPDCTRFTVSVEASEGVTTGISAADRARTIAALADPDSNESSLVSPGHIFPVRVERGGVLTHASEMEAGVDLARLASVEPISAVCAVLGADGSIAGAAELDALAQEHGLTQVKLSELVRYRMEREFFVRPLSEGAVDTVFGSFRLIVFENELDGLTHPVLVHGDPASESETLVRIHSQCLTGDVFHSVRCDCGDQMSGALEQIGRHGAGVLVYLRQEGRGIGLVNKIKAYALQDRGKDTVDANLALGFGADERSYVVAAQILKHLGIARLRMITNNERKMREMEEFGLEIAERVALAVTPRKENEAYLRTKRDRLGHLLDL